MASSSCWRHLHCSAAVAVLCCTVAARLQAPQRLRESESRDGFPPALAAALPVSDLQVPFYYTAQLYRIGLPGDAPTLTAPLILGSAAPGAVAFVPADEYNVTIRYCSDALLPPA